MSCSRNIKDPVSELDNTVSADSLYRNNYGIKRHFKRDSPNVHDNRRPHTTSSSGKHNFISSCRFCGTSHNRRACSAYGTKCTRCSRPNDSANVCQARQPPRVDTLHHVHDDSENGPQPRAQINISELFIEVIEVSSLDCHDNELVIPMLVNNTKIDDKIGTGAMYSLRKFTNVLNQTKGIKPNLIPCNTKLKSHSVNSIPVLGRCTIQCNNKSVECDFFVVDLKKRQNTHRLRIMSGS